MPPRVPKRLRREAAARGVAEALRAVVTLPQSATWRETLAAYERAARALEAFDSLHPSDQP